MKGNTNYYIVDKNVLPEIFSKVVQVKKIIASNKEKTIQAAVSEVGISRSAFYKYKDSVFEVYENALGKTITVSFQLEDEAGILSHILNFFAKINANILTINQTIPINNLAIVTMSIETRFMNIDIKKLNDEIEKIEGVNDFRIISKGVI